MSFLVARRRPMQAAACRVCRRCPLRRHTPHAPITCGCGAPPTPLLLLCVGKVVVYN